MFSATGHQLSVGTGHTPRCLWLSSFIWHEEQLAVVRTEATRIFSRRRIPILLPMYSACSSPVRALSFPHFHVSSRPKGIIYS